MILHRNPVMSAIGLIANFFCLAALYLLLRAQLLAVLQIIVYTGAIMVLVVFVIMLLNLGRRATLSTERFSLRMIASARCWASACCWSCCTIFWRAVAGTRRVHGRRSASRCGGSGELEWDRTALFGRFLLPFEVTSLLLLAAIVGAVILAKKRVTWRSP